MKFFLLILVTSQITGCAVISVVATSVRKEAARSENAGKQLVPEDGGTYLIPIATETRSLLGSGSTEWKINGTSFIQPKGSYSQISVTPGIYTIYGNKHVAGGGEATSPIDVKESETICFYVSNPISTPARIDFFKNDLCDPFLRSIKKHDVVEKILDIPLK